MATKTDIDVHRLNKVLAELWVVSNGEQQEGWDPCTDHYQGALVEEKLREKGYGYELTWFHDRADHRAMVWKLEDHGTVHTKAWHESKLLALALAVESMLQLEQKPEHVVSDKSGK